MGTCDTWGRIPPTAERNKTGGTCQGENGKNAGGGKEASSSKSKERLAQGTHRKYKSLFKNCIVFVFFVFFLFIMVGENLHAKAHMWSIRTSFLVLFFHCVGCKDHTQVITIGNKHFYMLSHLDSPQITFLTGGGGLERWIRG